MSIAQGAGYAPAVRTRAVIAANPDFMFVAHAAGDSPDAAAIATRPGWATCPRGDDAGHVVVLDTDLASRWGPSASSTSCAPWWTPPRDAPPHRRNPDWTANPAAHGPPVRSGGTPARLPGQWVLGGRRPRRSALVAGVAFEAGGVCRWAGSPWSCWTTCRGIHADSRLSPIEAAIVTEARLPRAVLAAMVGELPGQRRRRLPGRVPQPAGRPVPPRRRRAAAGLGATVGHRGHGGGVDRRATAAVDAALAAFLGAVAAVDPRLRSRAPAAPHVHA